MSHVNSQKIQPTAPPHSLPKSLPYLTNSILFSLGVSLALPLPLPLPLLPQSTLEPLCYSLLLHFRTIITIMMIIRTIIMEKSVIHRHFLLYGEFSEDVSDFSFCETLCKDSSSFFIISLKLKYILIKISYLKN